MERLLPRQGRPPAAVHRLHRAPRGRGAAVRDRAAPGQGQDLDAPAGRHHASCAPSSTWTRSSATSRRIPQNPPPKRPLLTLLKQARAQGVGVVLATQNPVDLDYKGLANIGTWFVGKLQTDQDRERLRDGLLGRGHGGRDAGEAPRRHRASASSSSTTSTGPGPCLLHSRWAMSYLRGPLTRDEIARLMTGRAAAAAPGGGGSGAPSPTTAAAAGPPVLPPPLRPRVPLASRRRPGQPLPAGQVRGPLQGGGGDGGRARVAARPAGPWRRTSRRNPWPCEESAVAAEPPAGAALRRAAGLRRLAARGGSRRPSRTASRTSWPATLWSDPVTRAMSRPGEDRRGLRRAARRRSAGARAAGRTLRERLEKKRRDLAARSRTWRAASARSGWPGAPPCCPTSASSPAGRGRSPHGPTAMRKQRMEDTAESRVEALRAEVAALEAEAGRGTVRGPGALPAATGGAARRAAWSSSATTSCGSTERRELLAAGAYHPHGDPSPPDLDRRAPPLRAVRVPRSPSGSTPVRGRAAAPAGRPALQRRLLAERAGPLHAATSRRRACASWSSTRPRTPSASSPARWTSPRPGPRPWFKRWPVSAWRVFLATAFRLSPARRILFALAVPLLWLAWAALPPARSVAGGSGKSAHAFTLRLDSSSPPRSSAACCCSSCATSSP